MSPVVVSLLIAAASTAANVGIMYLTRPKGDQSPIDIGKMDDVRVTGSEYGAFIPRYWGTARMGGNIIWSTGIDHRIVELPSEGGKGAPQAPATRYHSYRSSMGWLIARSETDTFLRLWADEDPYIGRSGENSQTIDGPDVPNDDIRGTTPDDWVKSSTAPTYLRISAYTLTEERGLTLDVTAVDLPPLPTGGDAFEASTPRTKITVRWKPQSGKIAGQSITATDGVDTYTTSTIVPQTTEWLIQTFDFAGDIETVDFIMADTSSLTRGYLDYDYFLVEKYWAGETTGGGGGGGGTGERQGMGISGIADPDSTYDPDALDLSGYYNYLPSFDANGTLSVTNTTIGDSFRFYSGTMTQLQDSALIDYLDLRYNGQGSTYAPAHRGMTWMAFKNFGLRRGRVPNFTAEVQNSRNQVNTILTDFAEDVGLVAGDLALTATSALEVTGYIESTKASRKTHWENLSRYWGFRFGEIDGKITTIPDTFTSVATISADSLRAHKEGEQTPVYDAEIIVTPSNELPREVRFSTLNPNLDYFNDTAAAAIFADNLSTDVIDMNFPIVAEPEEARKRAETMLLKIQSENRIIKFSGMPELMKYAIGDVITVPINGENLLVRIEKKTADLPLGIVTIDGTVLERYEAGDIDSAVVASQVSSVFSADFGYVEAPRNGLAIPIISLPIRAADRGRLGMYIAVTPRGRGVSENVALYQEVADETYILKDLYDIPSKCGVAEDILGNYTGSLTAEDTTNTIDILFYNNESLESVTAADLARNPELNLLRVGDEWIQFRTATIQTLDDNSPYRSKWRVSNLLRGRFGTSGAISGHVADENVVLNTPTLKFYDLSDADVGKTVTFKAVSGGQDIEQAKAVSVTFNPISAYTVTHGTPDRAFDANNTTIHEIADVVATIIDDLKL